MKYLLFYLRFKLRAQEIKAHNHHTRTGNSVSMPKQLFVLCRTHTHTNRTSLYYWQCLQWWLYLCGGNAAKRNTTQFIRTRTVLVFTTPPKMPSWRAKKRVNLTFINEHCSGTSIIFNIGHTKSLELFVRERMVCCPKAYFYSLITLSFQSVRFRTVISHVLGRGDLAGAWDKDTFRQHIGIKSSDGFGCVWLKTADKFNLKFGILIITTWAQIFWILLKGCLGHLTRIRGGHRNWTLNGVPGHFVCLCVKCFRWH